MLRTECLEYFKVVLISLPLMETRGSFSPIFTANWSGFWGRNSPKCRGPSPHDWSPLETLSLILVHAEPLGRHSSGFPTVALVPTGLSALVSRDSLYWPVCRSNSGDSGSRWTSHCSDGSLDFSVCSVFHLSLGLRGDFQLLMCQIGNWKS